MSFIDYISYEDASDELKEVYESLGGGPGKTLANVVRVAGPNPKVLKAHIQFYRAVMQTESPLSGAQKEAIAVVVSGVNGCHY